MSLNKPLITVATITYNSGRWVQQTIDSVLAQTFTDFELLICDDCSTDNTWEIIESVQHPRIRKYKNPQNLREYANRNKALELANGEYIIYIDGDDIIYKDTLERFARYIKAFPEAAAIWGVSDVFFDFVAFPYLFSPVEITRLLYLSDYPISIVGFAESLFKINTLKEIGSFRTDFGIGDTYIKKRIACEYPVLLTTRGYSFWRQTNNQASKKVTKNYINMVEEHAIDMLVIEADYFPLKGDELTLVKMNTSISIIKRIVKNTLLRGKILDFFSLMNRLKQPYLNLRLLFSKIHRGYKCNANGERPLINNFNFTKSAEDNF